MTAQRELMERELDVERASLSQSPEGEALELRGMYEQRGIDPEVARDMVHEVMAGSPAGPRDPRPGGAGHQPRASGLARAVGVVLVLHLRPGCVHPARALALHSRATAAIVASVVLSAVAAIAVGVVLAAFTHRSVVRSALRQLILTAGRPR